MKTIKKIALLVNFLRLTLLIAMAVSIYYNSWTNLALSVLTMLLTFLPSWFEKKYKIDIPLDFELIIILFIYASLFLGEINNFYEYFWWWDILLHAVSAFSFTCIGFVILSIVFEVNQVKAHPAWLSIFSFCFAISIGVLWEIYEFSMDQLFGFNMQKSGLMDTMWDLITDCLGSAFASLTSYSYLEGGKRSYVGHLVNLFFAANPEFKNDNQKELHK